MRIKVHAYQFHNVLFIWLHIVVNKLKKYKYIRGDYNRFIIHPSKTANENLDHKFESTGTVDNIPTTIGV